MEDLREARLRALEDGAEYTQRKIERLDELSRRQYEGKRVRYSDEFRAQYEGRVPDEWWGEGTVEEDGGLNKYGYHGLLVAWDRMPFNPQQAGVKDLTVIS